MPYKLVARNKQPEQSKRNQLTSSAGGMGLSPAAGRGATKRSGGIAGTLPKGKMLSNGNVEKTPKRKL